MYDDSSDVRQGSLHEEYKKARRQMWKTLFYGGVPFLISLALWAGLLNLPLPEGSEMQGFNQFFGQILIPLGTAFLGICFVFALVINHLVSKSLAQKIKDVEAGLQA